MSRIDTPWYKITGLQVIIWGGIHGLLLMINHQWRRLNINLPKAINWGVTFLCVMICWVFFRAESFNDAINVLNSMVDFQTVGRTGLKRLAVLCIMIGILTVVPNPLILVQKFTANNKWLLIACILFLVSIYRIASTGTGDFLYFQF